MDPLSRCRGDAPASASAFVQNPAWTVSVIAAPTNFAPEDKTGRDHYDVIVTNTGDAPTDGSTVTITDALPAHLALDGKGVSASELLSSYQWPNGPHGSLSCSGLACTFAGRGLGRGQNHARSPRRCRT